MNLEFYDKKILDEIAGELQVPAEGLKQYDEKPKKAFLSRTVKGHTNSPEELLAQLQFDFIRRKAEEGKSFVIVGRCAETVLRGREALISIFVSGRQQQKTERIMEKYQLSASEAEEKMRRMDRTRRQYHNRYSDTKWEIPGVMICVSTAVRWKRQVRCGCWRHTSGSGSREKTAGNREKQRIHKAGQRNLSRFFLQDFFPRSKMYPA